MRDLTTARLLLRPIGPDDASALHVLWTNKEVRRYLWDNRILPLDAVHTIISDSAAYFDRTGSGFFSVRLKEQPDGIVGFCGHRAFEAGEEAELLYGMHPDHWRQGLGTEAARRVLDYGFNECGLAHVIATTDTPNQRSVKVLQRLGMSFDRRQLRHGLDTVFYRMTRREFLALAS
ncbi:MAG: GNAT family N-acetyltransferase [Pseudomonadales bacterium]|nr:GNAT family N-acetyltransferase [Pseudomonadales bacterium]MCP5185036.1 GNAT family N-acetyltransferase [Pseudomonadales bacterium]